MPEATGSLKGGRPIRARAWGLFLLAACALTLWLGHGARDLAVNLAIPLDTDEAQYVGSAVDFLETGRFLESVHNESLPHFMPLGYPLLIVAVTKLLHFEPHKAALFINLAAGTLLPVVVLLLTWRLTGSPSTAALAGLWAAANWPLVELSAQAMTDIPYMTIFLLMAWGLHEFFRRERPRHFLALCLIQGLLFATMYLIRISAIYMLAAVPLACLALNRRRRVMPWSKMAAGLALFLVLGLAVVLANAWRWQQLNGYFTLSPQVAGNITVGNYESKGDDDLFRVHESGNTTVRRYLQRHGQTVLQEAASPLTRARILAENTLINLEFMWFGLWGWERERGEMAFWALLAILLAIALARRLGARASPGPLSLPLPGRDEMLTGVWVLTIFTLVHLLTYSLAVHFRRYMIQVTPFLIILVCVGFRVLFWRGCRGLAVMGTVGHGARRLVIQLAPPPPRLGLLRPASPGAGGLHHLEAIPAAVRANLWLAVGLALLLLWLGLLDPYQDTMQRAGRRDAVVAPTPAEAAGTAADALAGVAMRTLAARQGAAARVMAESWAVPYYAHGTGFPVPYTDERPGMLLRYLRSNAINFVMLDPRATIGSRVTGVPLGYLLETLSGLDQPWVARHQPGPFYQIKAVPEIREVGRMASLEGGGMDLPEGRFYLIQAELAGQGQQGKRIGRGAAGRPLFTLRGADGQARELTASLCPGVQINPLNLPLPLGRLLTSSKTPEQGEIDWRLYLAFSTHGLGRARLEPLPQGLGPPLRSFREAVLYELSGPGGEAGPGKEGGGR